MSAPDSAPEPSTCLLVVVVTHTAPQTLPEILDALRNTAGPPHVLVLFIGVPASSRLTAARKAAADHGTDLLLTPGPQPIGAARAWLITRLPGPARCCPDTVAFLDDDCVPRTGWHAAARAAAAAGAALAFGPRFPGRLRGLGAQVRAAEAARSRKLLGAAAVGPVAAPRMLVAGGNMLVSLRAARKLGITHPAFTAGAFEDVDLQLRARAAGERVEYWPGLAVDHHDTLTAWRLLRKSVLSGTGMAACAARHGGAFWQCCRWRPARQLGQRLALVLAAGLGAAILLPPGRLPIAAAAVLPAMTAAACTPVRRRLAVPILRTMRDMVLSLSYLAGRARLALAHRAASR
jgi:GT2 family glycosyltransferase